MANEWFLKKGERVIGPLTSAELRALISTSQINHDDMVRNGPDKVWKPAWMLRGTAFPNKEKITEGPERKTSVSTCATKLTDQAKPPVLDRGKAVENKDSGHSNTQELNRAVPPERNTPWYMKSPLEFGKSPLQYGWWGLLAFIALSIAIRSPQIWKSLTSPQHARETDYTFDPSGAPVAVKRGKPATTAKNEQPIGREGVDESADRKAAMAVIQALMNPNNTQQNRPTVCGACGGKGTYSFVDSGGNLRVEYCPYCQAHRNFRW